MNKIKELIKESNLEFKRKLADYARSLVGKRVRLFHKNHAGPVYDAQVTVKAIIHPEGDHFPLLFLVKDEKSREICIWEDTNITEIRTIEAIHK